LIPNIYDRGGHTDQLTDRLGSRVLFKKIFVVDKLVDTECSVTIVHLVCRMS